MSAEEDGHRHRLIELHRARFGEHIPLIRRQDVKGFVERKPIWLVRPLGLSAVRKQTELMELETKQFYEAAAPARPTPESGSFWETWPRKSAGTRSAPTRLEGAHREAGLEQEEAATERRLFLASGDSARARGAHGRISLDARPHLRRGLCDP